jgi:hypothetical protein
MSARESAKSIRQRGVAERAQSSAASGRHEVAWELYIEHKLKPPVHFYETKGHPNKASALKRTEARGRGIDRCPDGCPCRACCRGNGIAVRLVTPSLTATIGAPVGRFFKAFAIDLPNSLSLRTVKGKNCLSGARTRRRWTPHFPQYTNATGVTAHVRAYNPHHPPRREA